jgi:SAM-dependent methyltransferase
MARWRRGAARSLRELLLVDGINRLVFAARFLWFVRGKAALRQSADDRAVIAGEYSLGMLKKGKTSNRPLRLIRPLSVIDHVSKDARVLSVGCRFETELLYLIGHGFRADRVRGLDMISYSPWVDVGNMHDMPYEDDSWDVAILGWVLPYSDEPERAAAEVTRVLVDGGVVAVGLSWYPERELRRLDAAGTLVGGVETRIQTVDQILGVFGNHVDEVIFRHDAVDPEAEGVCMVIFTIKKDAKR